MKIITLTLASIMIFGFCFSQTNFPKNNDGEISFTEVVKTNNQLNAADIYENFKEWVSSKSSNFNRSNTEKNAQGTEIWLAQTKGNFQQIDALFKNDNPLKLSDKESHKIIAKIVNKYTGGTMGCIRVIYVEYDLIVKIKDGRYKYEIKDFFYTHYNQASGKQIQIYGWKDEGACKSKGDLNELLSCSHCKKEFQKFYFYLKSDLKDFTDEMKKEIDKKVEEEDW